ncbi:unnamed protein product [Cylindrotheca closterium]|uniref:Uncharacterized protein n=1 Tax=Cylindrotheca closterium TaxID=2856 RepID=A0AAD2CTN7_9STRA|nr:unnamed protein product [Cylindrotheca closterium]
MTTVTGIPPHIEVACQLKDLRKDMLDLIKATGKNKKDRKAAEKEFREQVTNAVRGSIEQENVNNGNVSGSCMISILDNHKTQTKNELKKMLTDFKTTYLAMTQGQPQAPPIPPIQGATTTNCSLSSDTKMFQYINKWWFVPEIFQFQKPPNLSLLGSG